jgi:glucose-1-phosphate adenylyltransferase
LQRVLTVLLAGGAGERLFPLTAQTAKPAVPFGGIYRIVDFTLSNCINSSLRRIFILTQYKALELNRHIRQGWSVVASELGEFIEVIPPMKRIHADWYLGTADAVYQNMQSIRSENCPLTLVLSADHIYKMDYREMVAWHDAQRADVTIATIQLPPQEAPRFGVCAIDSSYRITGFEEKPTHGNPPRSVFDPERISASMGIYLFNTNVLLAALEADAGDPESSHDFGKDVLPRLIRTADVTAYDFHDLNDKRSRYWRDVGTLDAYYEANMDLVAVTPEFNLYDAYWPVRTHMPQQPPAKFVFAEADRRMGVALDSIVSPGCIISGARVNRSVLSPGARLHSYSTIEECIVLPHAEVGAGSHLRKTIVPAGVVLPPGTMLGFDAEADRARGCTVTPGGVVVAPADFEALQAGAAGAG